MRRTMVALLTALALSACSESREPAPATATVDTTHVDHTATPETPAIRTPLRGSDISYAAGDGEARGYVVEPPAVSESPLRPADGPTVRPGLIVIHEWWGLDDWVRQTADRFAEKGYVVIAPDLYRGRSTADPTEAHELMRGLPDDRALADLKAAWAQLAAREDVDATRIGVAGWCMGGGYALVLATEEPRLAAVNINYGRLIEDRGKLAGIQAPVLGIFGAADRGIPVEDVRAFEAALENLGKQVEIHIYDGAGHAFMNPNNKEGFAPDAAEDAWQKIDAFLAGRLGNDS